MQYVLAGFTHSTGFRVFEFEGVADNWVRTRYSVRADLALARKHGIPVQALPLLCRAVLELRGEGDERRAFTYTEGDMSFHASALIAEAESRKKKTPRTPAAAASELTSLSQPV